MELVSFVSWLLAEHRRQIATRYWALGLVATTAEPPSPPDLRARDERADATERGGMDVLVDYMHTGLHSPSCPPAVPERSQLVRGSG